MSHHIDLHIPSKHSPSGLPLFACGFRPFFFGGALSAALLIFAWLFIFFDGVQIGGPAGPIGWHAHEMLFGFTTAIIAGFLLTAVPKWTRTTSLQGALLAILFFAWLLGRLAMALSFTLPYLAVALTDLLFLPLLAIAISRPIIKARTPRNYGFVPLLSGLFLANLLYHLHHLDLITFSATAALDAALAIIAVIIAIVGGRVIPFFTANRLQFPPPSRTRLIDRTAIILTTLWLFSFFLLPAHAFTASIAIMAGLSHFLRMRGWQSLKTRTVPLLWILHTAYAFLALGLILFGLASLDVAASRTIALHSLTTGTIGIICLGMMARVALGHTGRKLQASPTITIAFGLIITSALLRVLGPWLLPALYQASITASALTWTAAWTLFLIVYTPILLRPRADGRPG